MDLKTHQRTKDAKRLNCREETGDPRPLCGATGRTANAPRTGGRRKPPAISSHRRAGGMCSPTGSLGPEQVCTCPPCPHTCARGAPTVGVRCRAVTCPTHTGCSQWRGGGHQRLSTEASGAFTEGSSAARHGLEAEWHSRERGAGLEDRELPTPQNWLAGWKQSAPPAGRAGGATVEQRSLESHQGSDLRNCSKEAMETRVTSC